MQVPYFKPSILPEDIAAVVRVLESGWLTTGPRVHEFETQFAAAVGAPHAVALNSATAALHLGAEAMGLGPGDAVLVPTMTFAATAEIVRYLGATPLLVDSDPVTLNLDLVDAARKLTLLKRGDLPCEPGLRVVGIIPVHVGGLMMPIDDVRRFAATHGLWIVEDAAHAFPAAVQTQAKRWVRCGEQTADISCYSFYANKTITTGEGGMAVTADARVAERIRLMSLHGMSKDAWKRYANTGNWDYRLVAAGFKYNMTDVAAALGLCQLNRAEEMREQREAIAKAYRKALASTEEIELPPAPSDRVHSWHLFPIRLRLDRLGIDRAQFMYELAADGVGSSVHWRPLHLHPLYESAGWQPDLFPVATREWLRLVSLPIFPSMTTADVDWVVSAVNRTCARARLALT
jgi:dTDP-4-amino-4,6-dideoxygalactose transaminase